MTARPIIFSGPMIRAIQDGRKLQTRRVVFKRRKDRGGNEAQRCEHESDGWWFYYDHPSGNTWRNWCLQLEACPYGQPGDRMWVRETFAHVPEHDCIYYRADDPAEYDTDGPWTPSIYMPRWASRITLEIVDVRVERVQEISEDDARAEGVEPVAEATPWGEQTPPYWFAFMRLWHDLNAKRGYGWDVNPWVWCIAFRRVPS